jgi:hypothetical protein
VRALGGGSSHRPRVYQTHREVVAAFVAPP